VLGEGRLKEIADRLLRAASADQTEVVIQATDEQLTRFAENKIHQNVAETDAEIRVRSVLGKRIGVATGNDLSDEGLAKVVRDAEEIAGLQQENPEFRSLPGAAPAQAIDAFSRATADCSPARRAQGVEAIFGQARSNDLSAAGAFSTSVNEIGVYNSLGVSAYHCGTLARVMTVVMSEDSSGYAAEIAKDVELLDPANVGHIAVDKAVRSRNPQAIEPGSYTVFLEPEAVGTMLFYLGYLGLGSLSMQEKRSFLTGRMGERVTGGNITIWDDGLDPEGFALPFDFEGVPRQKIMLIEGGVGRNVVYDSFTAGREEGKASTGHALPSPNMVGPIPMHLHMAPGASSREEMIESIERGIWVTRFHYTNPVHPVKTVLTGMTRDGTFLIENGKVTRPLKNLRFTQSILEAFANARMMCEEATLVHQGWGGVAVSAPSIVVDGFEFTGVTEF